MDMKYYVAVNNNVEEFLKNYKDGEVEAIVSKSKGRNNDGIIADVMAIIEGKGKNAAYLICNAKALSEIRKHSRDVFDVETRKSVLKLGIMGCIWGAMVIVSRDVPEENWIVCSDDFKDVAISKVEYPNDESLKLVLEEMKVLIDRAITLM